MAKRNPESTRPLAVVEGLPANPPGVLYLLGTPIGNLEDITLRALRVLREVDCVACEDTRQTQKLLTHFAIQTRTVSYHEHNEMTRAPELVLQLEQGARIALVTDAGMPCISDPGYRLVQLCARHRITVVPVPGASAVLAALSASGLPTHSFHFAGFLPPRDTARRKALSGLSEISGTMVLFESPHRVVDLLVAVRDTLGERPVVVARELTKIHEELLRGRCSEVLSVLQGREKVLGEITVLIGAADEHSVAAPQADTGNVPIADRVLQLMNEHGVSRMEALKRAARERGISKSQAWRELESSQKR
ncbi:MAG: 16S rRNA (cytidine(1402)-2'-O)-methyltransferase [Acidobacteria bacterium]|nr:16S rRNA (cytidine(1402)-2'-O)-methyltransferase [Acidobacteriota bacterium]